MLPGTFASAEERNREQQKAEEKFHIESEHYSNSHVCVLVSDFSVKINHDSSVPQKSSDSPQHTEARGGGDANIFRECFFFFFFFIEG